VANGCIGACSALFGEKHVASKHKRFGINSDNAEEAVLEYDLLKIKK
jgi:hypothetical protein